MTSRVRSGLAFALWIAAGLLTLFLVFSGWLLFAPFVFAGGGGEQILLVILAVFGLSTAAHLIRGRAAS